MTMTTMTTTTEPGHHDAGLSVDGAPEPPKSTTSPSTARRRRLRAERAHGSDSLIPARLRIVGWILLAVALTLVAVVITIRSTSVASVERQANASISQEVDEFATFAERWSETPDAGPPELLVRSHLERQFPADDQVLLGLRPAAGREPLIVQDLPDPVGLSEAPDKVAALVESGQGSGVDSLDGVPFRWAAVEVDSQGPGDRAAFVVAVSTVEARSQIDRELAVVGVVCLVGLLLTAVIAWLVAGRILEPVRVVRRAASRTTHQDLDRRIEVTGRDDVSALATTFNQMMDRIQAAFASQRRFADAAVAHLRHVLELFERDTETSPQRDAALARMNAVIDDLGILAAADAPDFAHPQEIDLGSLLTRIGHRVDADTGERFQRPTDLGAATGTAWVDADLVVEAIVRLARNAATATRDPAALALGAQVDGDMLRVWVTDDGPGLDAEHARRLFHQFERPLETAASDGSPSEGRRLGLGLAVAKAVADAHEGSAWVDCDGPGRCAVGLTLPRRTPEGGQP
jgi:signal transduction histidine kinase